MENNTNNSRKTSQIILTVIGIICIILAFTLLFIGIVRTQSARTNYEIEMEQYEQDYDRWFNEWFGNPNSSVGINDKPEPPSIFYQTVGVPFFITAFISLFAGVVTLVFGTKKIVAKHHEDLENIHLRIKQNKTDNGNQVTTKEKDIYCPYCGVKVGKNDTECKTCGFRLKS